MVVAICFVHGELYDRIRLGFYSLSRRVAKNRS